MSEQGLVAREFDSKKLTLGPPRALVSQIRPLQLGVSPGGVLLYQGGSSARRVMWLDRSGKNLEAFNEPGA